MRQIILDTETTGLDPASGHRIIEIGCVELINRQQTSRIFQHYIRPDRHIDFDATKIHGITSSFLQDKPTFGEIFNEFLEFVRDAELIIHNAPFDVGFLNAEMALLGTNIGKITHYCSVFDTLTMARRLHPGQRNSLDALCKRYKVDNTHRQLHGALLDANILTHVYLSMTGGQTALQLDSHAPTQERQTETNNQIILQNRRQPLPVVFANAEELAVHQVRLSKIKAQEW